MVEIAIDKLKDELKDCFVIVDSNVFNRWGAYFLDDCHIICGGEGIKNFEAVESLIGVMAKSGIKKGDRVAVVGGGAVIDMVGFVCSIYMRGLEWINVPTTLLAMIDSSIGGKTAINSHGIKNLVGSFKKPVQTYVCHEFLQSLDDGDMNSGWGEIIKMALLDRHLFRLVDDRVHLNQIIKECIKLKERFVKKDFYDKGERRFLNLGHTIGHGIESVYALKHGVCVAMGLVLESKILGLINEDLLKWIEKRVGEIAGNKIEIDIDKVIGAMQMDKKNVQNICFCALVDVGEIKIIELTKEELAARWKGLG